MAVKVPVMQSTCGCCPCCEASAGSLQDVIVGPDVFIGAAEAVMDCVAAAEVLNASYIVPGVLSPRTRVVAHIVTTAATTDDQDPYSGRNR